MSQENVEAVRRAYEAWNSGDADGLYGVHHPDVIAHYPEGWPEGGPFVGRDAVVGQLQAMRDAWGDTNQAEAITDFIDVGDRVIARFVWRGEGHGPSFALEGSAVYTLRDGKIFVIEYFTNHAEALEAVGLSE